MTKPPGIAAQAAFFMLGPQGPAQARARRSVALLSAAHQHGSGHAGQAKGPERGILVVRTAEQQEVLDQFEHGGFLRETKCNWCIATMMPWCKPLMTCR